MKRREGDIFLPFAYRLDCVKSIAVGKKLNRELIVIKDFIKYSLIYLIVVANKVPGTGNMMNNKTKCTKALELVMPCRSKA